MRRKEAAAVDRPRVLIVDDNPDKLIALESVLLSLDVDIVTAESGRGALRRLLEQDYAVILLDVRMPGMDGFETASMIRQRERSANTPIIFITAFSEEMQVSRGYSLRAVDYILAPVVPEVLRTKVSVLVELFRATAEVRRQAERLRRRTAQLHELALASLGINAAQSVDAMVEIVAPSAIAILEAEGADVVAAVDEARSRIASSVVARDGIAQPIRSPVGPEVRRTNHTVRMEWDGGNGEARYGLGVPLVGRDGGNLGSIAVARAVAFDQEDEDLLVQLAQSTSIAVENTIFSEAREANRLKDEFIAAVSHELRTPLNALRSWSWLLRQGNLTPERLAKVVDGIERSVAAQARIIDDLLDVSRIVAGKMSLRFETLDVAPVVQRALDALVTTADAAGVRVVASLDGAGHRIEGDGDRLQQIVSNLLSNAIKFTPSGGRVDVSLAASGSQMVLRIADTGCGIAPGFLPHVFDRFRQADGTSTRRAGGLGVGLTIVRELVEMHGGRVEAFSEGEGSGATFTVTLPLLGPAAASADADAADAPAHVGVEGARVLIVEDDPDTQNVMTIVLSEAGAAVTTAGTAGDGIARLAAQPFDAIICDIGLPGEDGYSFIRRARALRERVRRVPALAVTAFARERDVEHARDAGFDGHLAKPVDPGELLRTLGTLLGRPGDPVTSGVEATGARDARLV